MRLIGIFVRDLKPIDLVEMDRLSDIVVIAGPNGVGKTRLITGLLNHAQQLNPDPNFHIRLEATSASEENTWGKKFLSTNDENDASILRTSLQRNRRRSGLTGSFLNFESNRSIQQITPLTGIGILATRLQKKYIGISDSPT